LTHFVDYLISAAFGNIKDAAKICSKYIVGIITFYGDVFMIKKVHVKTGDTVVVLNGKDRGKKGKILEVSPKEGKVIVEKVNLVSKHVKPRKMGEQGGIVKAEAALYACKVQILCPRCNKPTRIAHKICEDKSKDRICKKCGETL
jgi:large subunit ribosomal protein L24